MQIIKAPWKDKFVELIKSSTKKIYLSSPFIKENVAKLIVDNKRDGVDCRILTKFTLPNIRCGGLDLSAIKIFQDFSILQKNISNLHAKFYIFDSQAIVSSANLTNGGLSNNLEYGILVDGAEGEIIEKDFLNYYDNPEYNSIKNEHVAKVAGFLKNLPTIDNKIFHSFDSQIFLDDISLIKKDLTPGNLKIIESIDENGKDLFTRKDLEKFKNKFSGKTPMQTVSRNLQELRDVGLLEFVSRGSYKKLWK